MASEATSLPSASDSIAEDSHQWWWSRQKLWTICVTLLLAWLCYFCMKYVKRILWVLSELFVFWKVAVGATGTGRLMQRSLRLYVYLCETQYLDEVSVNELHSFLQDMLASDSASIEVFHRVLLTYSHIMICRERTDGSLRGIILVGIDRKEKYTLMKVGLAVFKNYYQGGPFAYLMPVCMALREKILHPFTPLYMVSKSFTFKSYMMVVKFKEMYPRYNRETPEFFKNMLNDFAEGLKRPNETYNPETFVLEREMSHAKNFVAPISEKELLNPNIKFFSERNPGWKKGHCMCTVATWTWSDILMFALLMFRRSKSPRTEPGKAAAGSGRKRSSRPPLKRGYTFQDPLAKQYAVNICEVDAFGGTTEQSVTNGPNPYIVRPPSITSQESECELNITADLKI